VKVTDGVKAAYDEDERVEGAGRADGERVEATRPVTAERMEAGMAAAGGATQAGPRRASAAELKAKPRFRGVFHLWAFPAALAGGAVLVATADGDSARLALGIYAAALAALLGVSALYHRIDWQPTARQWMRRLDHSMIFILIAATYTPFALLVIDTRLGDVVLAIVWVGALAGVLLNLFWPNQPKWVASLAALALGVPLIVAIPALASAAGAGAPILLGVGGLLYGAGAAVYAAQRPDPLPAVFGYHEILHLLVIAAAAAQFAAIAIYAAPG
jgi:hemolysin III